jgi:hypothetical protein
MHSILNDINNLIEETEQYYLDEGMLDNIKSAFNKKLKMDIPINPSRRIFLKGAGAIASAPIIKKTDRVITGINKGLNTSIQKHALYTPAVSNTLAKYVPNNERVTKFNKIVKKVSETGPNISRRQALPAILYGIRRGIISNPATDFKTGLTVIKHGASLF